MHRPSNQICVALAIIISRIPTAPGKREQPQTLTWSWTNQEMYFLWQYISGKVYIKTNVICLLTFRASPGPPCRRAPEGHEHLIWPLCLIFLTKSSGNLRHHPLVHASHCDSALGSAEGGLAHLSRACWWVWSYSSCEFVCILHLN